MERGPERMNTTERGMILKCDGEGEGKDGTEKKGERGQDEENLQGKKNQPKAVVERGGPAKREIYWCLICSPELS